MGTIKKGILGGFSGKVGNVVGASWKGVDYIRSLPSKVRNPRSKGQVAQRTRFSLIAKFVRALLPVIRVGFKQSAGAYNSAYSAAVSYNVQNAVKGEHPDFEIDFSNAMLSKGGLTGTYEATATREPGILNAEWEPEARGNASVEDHVAIAAYNPIKQEAMYDLHAASRGDGSGELQLPTAWDGDEVEAFVMFISEDGKQVSDSVYTGRLEAPAG